MNIDAKFGLVACAIHDMPRDPHDATRLSCGSAMSATCCSAAIVRCNDDESGNCTLTINRP